MGKERKLRTETEDKPETKHFLQRLALHGPAPSHQQL
jgi:hypothetical protein